MVEPVNAVAGGKLNREVDIEILAQEISKMKNIKTEFTDNERWQLVIEFDEDGKILLYRTGSYIIRGGTDLEELEETKDNWFELLKAKDIIDDLSSVRYSIQNVVFSGDLEQEIKLEILMIQLGIDKTEYEPEQFPGLIYRPESYSAVMLIFTSGKTIITGGTSKKQAESMMDHVHNQLRKI